MSIACFTGHRPKDLPWGYNNSDNRRLRYLKALDDLISRVIKEDGANIFLDGMAIGVDQDAALLVLGKKNEDIKLKCILPCPDQEKMWSRDEQNTYHKILDLADNVTYLNNRYTPTCMKERNEYMVNHSSILIAVYDKAKRASGTAQTIRLAKEKGNKIYILNPHNMKVEVIK